MLGKNSYEITFKTIIDSYFIWMVSTWGFIMLFIILCLKFFIMTFKRKTKGGHGKISHLENFEEGQS